jgi:uncharacterized protein YjdB
LRTRILLLAIAAVLANSCGGGAAADGGVTGPPHPVLTALHVSIAANTIEVGESAAATASGTDQNGASIGVGTVTWSTGSSSIATVTSSGVVTGVAVGQTQITATVGAKQASQSITVVPATIASVQITPENGSLTVGQSLQLTATAKDKRGNPVPGRTVSWYSSDLNVLGGTTNGNTATVTGIGAGTATVTATVDSVSGTATFTVASANAGVVSRIDFVPASVSLVVGQSDTVVATPRDASGNPISGKTVTWGTSDGAVVGGTATGNLAVLQGVGAGSANVTASVDGITGTLAVVVTAAGPKPVASVSISPASAIIAVGATLPMVATIRDAQGNILTGRTVAWATSNAAVAGGSAAGNVAEIQGLAVGTATITASSEGVTGTATVAVVSSGGGSVQLTCAGLAGGVVYAADGTYLGRLTNAFDNQSINNKFGPYGNQFSSTSMFNQFGPYGNPFGGLSAYNALTNTPPGLYVSSKFAAYVTKNTLKNPRVDPDGLRSCNFP